MASEIDYKAVLADLEERRLKLDAAIESIKAILGEGSSTTNGKGPSGGNDIAPDSFFGMSIVDAAKKYLRIVKSQKSTNAIVVALEQGGLTHTSKNFRNTVFSVLFRDFKAGGEIVRIAKKGWGLREWYPGMRKTNQGKNPEESETNEEE